MPDWTIYDPQLRQFAADGVSPTAMAKRLGFARQTVVDRLRKLGLKAPQPGKTSPTQEPPMPEDIGEVFPGQLNNENTDTPAADVVSAIADIMPVHDISEHLSPDEVQTLEH